MQDHDPEALRRMIEHGRVSWLHFRPYNPAICLRDILWYCWIVLFHSRNWLHNSILYIYEVSSGFHTTIQMSHSIFGTISSITASICHIVVLTSPCQVVKSNEARTDFLVIDLMKY
jgi:hypothetical protein